MRYTTQKPRAYWDEESDLHPTLVADTVITAEKPDAEWSGLFTANGEKLYRVREPVGFKVSD